MTKSKVEDKIKLCGATVTLDVPNEGAFVATCALLPHASGVHRGPFDQKGETSPECGSCNQPVLRCVTVVAEWGDQ